MPLVQQSSASGQWRYFKFTIQTPFTSSVKGVDEKEESSFPVGILKVSVPLQEMWEQLKINVPL